MTHTSQVDAEGKDLLVGDWVHVLVVPLSIRGLPEESKRAFSSAVGNTFQIESFDETGCLELDLCPKVSVDTIWIEPSCVRRIRRYKHLSKSFTQKLKQNAAPQPARFELKFDIVLKEGVPLEEFGHELISLGTSGGFAVWPAQNRITGSVYVTKSEPNATETLENAKVFALHSERTVSMQFADIVESNEI